MDQTRTLKRALQEAAVDEFSGVANTFDGGQIVTVVHASVPTLCFSYYWGDEATAIARVDQHVADNRRRREDDPREPMHEGAYVNGY